MANTLAYSTVALKMALKRFIVQCPEANVIKLFCLPKTNTNLSRKYVNYWRNKFYNIGPQVSFQVVVTGKIATHTQLIFYKTFLNVM